MRKTANRNLTTEQRDEVVRRYVAGESIDAVAPDFDIGRGTVWSILCRAGVPRRGNRVHHFDQSFFETIDTEPKAYWLGFVTADGSVRRDRLTVILQHRDRGHLKKFAAGVGGNPLLTEYRSGDRHVAAIQLASTKMASDLVRLGVTPNKTLTVRPAPITPGLARHYWRGVVDGDGSWGKKRGKPFWAVDLVGTKWMVEAFIGFVEGRISVARPHRPRPKSNSFNVKYAGLRLPQAIARLLYDDATVYLDRKKTVADELLSVPARRNCWLDLTAADLVRARAELGAWGKVATSLGIDRHHLLSLRRKFAISQ